MHRRIFSLILTALVMFGCTACGAAPEETEPPETAAPRQTQATPPTQTTAPETEPPVVWEANIHSGLRSDGSFNEGTLFIGDSLTAGLVCQYLMPNGLIGGARYMAKVGAPLYAFFGSSFLMETADSTFSWEFHQRSYKDSVALVGEEATAVYLMLGTNFDFCNNSDSYIKVVDYLLETCPNATIYLQLIPYSTSSTVHVDEVNPAILTAHSHFYEQGIQRVMVIDTHTAIGENLNADGIHLNAEGQRLWYEAIAAFAEDNQIPE